jgi:hypothetical protein
MLPPDKFGEAVFRQIVVAEPVIVCEALDVQTEKN